MLSRFCIDRPIFASVLSLLIALGGWLAQRELPLAQYPQVTPPTVQVNCNYPGASAEVVAQTVAAPIEQQVNGVEKMLYMESRCTNDGSYNLTVTFEQGVALNMAQVLVQNRVNLAVPMLPDVLKETGVTTRKLSPDILMSVNLNSPRETRDQLYLSNYALTQLRDELLRLPGIGDVFITGQRDYSMRIWLDPQQLASRNLTAGDVVRAVREQNADVACGRIGQAPSLPGQATTVTLTTLGRLSRPEQFADIIVRAAPGGRLVRLRDVGRVDLDAKNQDVTCRLDRRASVGLIIFQLPDANALDLAQRIRDKMDELSADFPDDMIYEIQYDTTPYTRQCIEEVYKSLREAILLVALVVLLFLQNWRSALIPLAAVPVAVMGTFGVMYLMGFSLNNLTLFGLVLAIGIVVDDAIVVVEAVEHHIEQGLSPREATIRAMSQVSGPVVAVGLVLSAVFLPCAFFGGITGQFFRQFALTIAASTVISAFNSLTLSPALSALLLKSRDQETHEPLPRLAFAAAGAWLGYAVLGPRCTALLQAIPQVPADLAAWASWPAAALAAALGWWVGKPAQWVLRRFFRWFNAAFRLSTRVYGWLVRGALRAATLVLLVYGGLVGLTWWSYRATPEGFIPTQDMGYLLLNIQLPDAAAAERTLEVTDRVQKICLGEKAADGTVISEGIKGVKHTVAVSGMSFLLSMNASYFGSMFVILDDFSQRRSPDLSADEIAIVLRRECAKQAPDALITVLPAPPVRGVGRTGGFKLMVEDRGNYGLSVLQQQADNLAEKARELRPKLAGLEQLAPEDRRAAEKQGVCPVTGEKLGSRGTPASLVRQGRTIYFVDEEAKARFAASPDEHLAKLTTAAALVTIAPNVFRANSPLLWVEMDRLRCMAMGVPLAEAFETLRAHLGSLYVNDFNRFGRTWQVIVQADAVFRNQVEKLRQLKVRNAAGRMAPIGSVADVRSVYGPLLLTRYNMYPAAAINGTANRGVSSRQAIDLMQDAARRELLPKMTVEFTEMAYLEIQAGRTGIYLFGLAVVMVFLVLAAQYESWALPLAVILVVPLCLLSALVGVWTAHMDNNIFTKIGFVVLVGLASKNAILIVEYAKRRREAGLGARDAAVAACQLRLRPIVMTSFAFILGVSPLLVAVGAGAEMRRTLGTAVFSGMLGVTLFGVFLTPVFFVVIDRLGRSRALAARGTRIAGDAILWVLTLKILWWPALFGIAAASRAVRRAVAPRRTKTPPARPAGPNDAPDRPQPPQTP